METEVKEFKKLLVFDIDGTLTDSVVVHQNAFRNALTAMGFFNFDDNWSNYMHHTDSYIFKTIFETINARKVEKEDIETFEGILANLLLTYTNNNPITEMPGARLFLQQVSINSGYDIVFATGSLLQPTKLKLAQCGIVIDEKLLVATNGFFSREELVSHAISEAKKYYDVNQYDEVYSFGDGRWDYETARNLNLKFIGIGNQNLVAMGVSDFYLDFTDIGLYELLLKPF